MDAVKIKIDAAQPPNLLVSVVVDFHPMVVTLRLAGLLCNTGKLARYVFSVGTGTMSTQSKWILFLQHIVFSCSGQTFAQIAHS